MENIITVIFLLFIRALYRKMAWLWFVKCIFRSLNKFTSLARQLAEFREMVFDFVEIMKFHCENHMICPARNQKCWMLWATTRPTMTTIQNIQTNLFMCRMWSMPRSALWPCTYTMSTLTLCLLQCFILFFFSLLIFFHFSIVKHKYGICHTHKEKRQNFVPSQNRIKKKNFVVEHRTEIMAEQLSVCVLVRSFEVSSQCGDGSAMSTYLFKHISKSSNDHVQITEAWNSWENRPTTTASIEQRRDRNNSNSSSRKSEHISYKFRRIVANARRWISHLNESRIF